MDAARQVLRFSIPGSIYLLLAAGLLVGGRLLQHDTLSEVSVALRENVTALLALLASIPLGFVLYQVYYSIYRPFRLLGPLWGRRWVRLDRGSRVLRELSPEQIELCEDALGLKDLEFSPSAYHPPEGQLSRLLRVRRLSQEFVDLHGSVEKANAAYRERWYRNWDILRALVEIYSTQQDALGFKGEYTTLSDVYHALGACRAAIWLAWLTSLAVVAAYIESGDGTLGRGAIAVIAGAAVCGVFDLVLAHTRRKTWKSVEALLRYGLRWAHWRLDPPISARTAMRP
ncbi:MAG TPA: hypothetical protein VNL97_08545 [Solirubrobacterales bacterium]|nr:hypothetical protein [Solirubrobacterales bacterium]